MMKMFGALVLFCCLVGCDQLSGKKEKPFTRQDGANLAKEVADAKTLAMKAEAAVAQDEFRRLGTQVYIGEGDDALLLTVPKDKDGRHQRASDYRFMILEEAERLNQDLDQWRKDKEEKLKRDNIIRERNNIPPLNTVPDPEVDPSKKPTA